MVTPLAFNRASTDTGSVEGAEPVVTGLAFNRASTDAGSVEGGDGLSLR